MSRCRRRVEGVWGNREVPPVQVLGGGGDMRAASAEANLREEGGSWGKHGFPHASEPKGRETAEASAG
jgi:hypothetical protein